MAARDPADTHPAALEESVPLDRLLRVVRAGGLIAARGRHPSEHEPVDVDEPDPDALHLLDAPPTTPPRWRVRRSVSTNTAWSASTTAGRAMMRTSQPGRNEAAISRSASRSRRRTRFLITAPPIRRPVAKPNRVVSRSVRRNRAVTRLLDRTVPCSWTAENSGRRESITRRGRRALAPLRPSDASDRVPVERPGSGDRPLSSCELGSHVPWPDGASWAGRSASSGVRVILSIRPRGTWSVDDPGRHANAPGRNEAHRRVCRPGDHRLAQVGVSNGGTVSDRLCAGSR
jgi:hypothetical protein